ncbi:MAG: YbaK/EbsC family protein, partial [Gaiellaceae bacterium]
MSADWPEPVERVARVLKEGRVEARIVEFMEGTPTADDAARAAGAPVDRIVKSLVFSCDGRAIVVMVPGDRRADTAKIAAVAGCDRVKGVGADAVEE